MKRNELYRKSNSGILTEREPLDVRVVGGKLARQREMAEHKIPVPRFFCLTIDFFEEAFLPLRDTVRKQLESIDFNDAQSLARVASTIRKLFSELSLSDAQHNKIMDAFDAHFAPGALVAVRASTVGRRIEESEDSADNPFAGMSETFLYVPRDQVIDKIKLCWASGFSAESMVYRHAQGFDLLGFGVSVALQEMVLGERSFVMFTSNPRTGSRETVIVAGYGIGEGVVQDKVAVDHYFINAATGELRSEIVAKKEKLTLDRAKGYGLTTEPCPEEQWEQPCLSAEEIEKLVAYGEKIEEIFCAPQDIEGTITADGTISFLQSRPIAFDRARMRVWSSSNVTESFPGATTALTYSFARYFYRVIFYDCYRRFGIHPDRLHDNFESLDRMIGFLGGRVYYSLNEFYHLHSQSPLFPIVRKHWEKMMGLGQSYETQPGGFWARTVGNAKKTAEAGGAVFLVLQRLVNHRRDVQDFHNWWEGLMGPLRGESFVGEDPLALVGKFHQVWKEAGNHWGITLVNDTFLPVLYGLTESWFKKWGLGSDESLLSDLLCGDERIVSVEILYSAIRLAEMVRSQVSLQQAFASKTAEEIWSAIENEELDHEFCQAVRTHLHRYGDRGLQELKIEQPNVRHDPPALLRMVQGYAAGNVTVDEMRSKEKKVRAHAEERLRRALSHSPGRRLLIRQVLQAVRTLIRYRENSRYCRSELFGFSKNIFRALGRYFVEQGILRQQDDIYHLTQDEIFGYLDGTGVTENLQAIADIRRKEFENNQLVETKIEVTTIGPVRQNEIRVTHTQESLSGVLRGLGSSTGRVRGRARVVKDPNNASLEQDSILVARETDPGWLFLMLASKGIVVERGSMLSHTAITGRKFGIPTIVSLPNATQRIPDNALIEMDGAAGLVTILQAE